MTYRTYTTQGLQKKLLGKLQDYPKDVDICKSIISELKDRRDLYMMPYDDQIYDVISCFDWSALLVKIGKLGSIKFIGNSKAEYTRRELVELVEDMLHEVKHADEGEYESYRIQRGYFHGVITVVRIIVDGIGLLEFSFNIGSMEVDYDMATDKKYY